MQLIKKPLDFYPHQCAITGRADGEIIDTGATISGIDPRVYLKAEVVEKMAVDFLGMVPKKDIEEVSAQVDSLRAKVEEMSKLIDAYQRREQAEADLEAAVS